MIMRIWHGVTAAARANEYLDYVKATGVKMYLGAKGNRGVYLLRRIRDDQAEFYLLSLWDSLSAVRELAGPDVNRAVYRFPRDREFLLEMEPHVAHFEILARRKAKGAPQSRSVRQESSPTSRCLASWLRAAWTAAGATLTRTVTSENSAASCWTGWGRSAGMRSVSRPLNPRSGSTRGSRACSRCWPAGAVRAAGSRPAPTRHAAFGSAAGRKARISAFNAGSSRARGAAWTWT